jgi:hypothetical protein
MAKIPKEWRKYFWEVNPDNVDMKEHAFYILGRVLDYGDEEAIKTCGNLWRPFDQKCYSTYSRGLSNRTIKRWQNILKLKPEECTKISSIRSKNPTWNY